MNKIYTLIWVLVKINTHLMGIYNINTHIMGFSSTHVPLLMGYENMGYFFNILTMYNGDIKKRKAHNLRRIRLKFGLKQKDIAEIIEAKEGNVSDMERGERTISDRVLNILCKKFNIDPVEFYYTPEMEIIVNPTEQKVIERMRFKPEIADQIDVISEAIASRSYGEKPFRQQSLAVQKKKAQRKPA